MQGGLHFVSELLHVTDSEARFRLWRDPLERAAPDTVRGNEGTSQNAR
jgi:hypothetical protein